MLKARNAMFMPGSESTRAAGSFFSAWASERVGWSTTCASPRRSFSTAVCGDATGITMTVAIGGLGPQ